jgi:hypothetical protein
MSVVATSRALIRWPQDQRVSLRSRFNLFRDAQDGVVDYSAHINPAELPAWPDGAGKIGAGLGRAGYGPAGLGDGGVGGGYGMAGFGPAGFGAGALSAETPLLADGAWKFGLAAADAAGNGQAPAAGLELAAELAGVPRPARSVVAAAYAGGALTLTLALSLDEQ